MLDNNLVVCDYHRFLGCSHEFAQVYTVAICLRCHIDAVAVDNSLVLACLSHRDVHGLCTLLAGNRVLYIVVENLHSQFVITIYALVSLVLEDVILDYSTNFLRQGNITCSTHIDTHVTAFQERILDSKEVIVLVCHVLCEVTYKVY